MRTGPGGPEALPTQARRSLWRITPTTHKTNSRPTPTDTLVKKEGIRAKIDSKEDYSPGWKFHEWELKGVPFRIEIGEKELKSRKVTLFVRDTKKKAVVSFSGLKNMKDFGKEYDLRLKKNADSFTKNKIVDCKSKSDIKKALDNGKVARANWCSVEEKGISCAEAVEKEIGAEVRGVLADRHEKAGGNCAICNRKAEAVVYIAKSY